MALKKTLENQIELYCREALLNRKNLESLHSFVSGYIISSFLRSFLLQYLPKDRSISWGQYILPSGELSKETDLIIFKGTPVKEYPYANYAIIELENVIQVIECKAFYEGPGSTKKEAEKHYKHLDEEQVLFYFERARKTLDQTEAKKIKEKHGLNIYFAWFASEEKPIEHFNPNIESVRQLIEKIRE